MVTLLSSLKTFRDRSSRWFFIQENCTDSQVFSPAAGYYLHPCNVVEICDLPHPLNNCVLTFICRFTVV